MKHNFLTHNASTLPHCIMQCGEDIGHGLYPQQAVGRGQKTKEAKLREEESTASLISRVTYTDQLWAKTSMNTSLTCGLLLSWSLAVPQIDTEHNWGEIWDFHFQKQETLILLYNDFTLIYFRWWLVDCTILIVWMLARNTASFTELLVDCHPCK